MNHEEIELSSSTTIGQYKSLEAQNRREEIGAFIVERFDERYFRPIEESPSKHGFALLAIACLVMETLESFYQGRGDTKGHSARMFRDFLAKEGSLRVLASDDNWFYHHIRCGILHQSETRGGWLVTRQGPLLNRQTKEINATRLLCDLRAAVVQFSHELEDNDQTWLNLKAKMAVVIKNCQ